MINSELHHAMIEYETARNARIDLRFRYYGKEPEAESRIKAAMKYEEDCRNTLYNLLDVYEA